MEALAGDKCGEEAAAHLWKKGHRKIGIFYQKDFLVKAIRMKGVLDFLGRQEAPVRAAWIVGFNGQGPTSEASAAAERFLRGAKEIPSAFVCGNDEDALHLIEAAERQGIRVPGDLSVVGFDNSDIAQLKKISLTSVDHPSFEIGEKAANIRSTRYFTRRSASSRTRSSPLLWWNAAPCGAWNQQPPYPRAPSCSAVWSSTRFDELSFPRLLHDHAVPSVAPEERVPLSGSIDPARAFLEAFQGFAEHRHLVVNLLGAGLGQHPGVQMVDPVHGGIHLERFLPLGPIPGT
jgi:hypothetical protein